MALKENMVTINGYAVHYWQDGNENVRPLLLLHGGFGDAWMNWSELIPYLAEDYNVIAPDLPGYGQSDALRTMRLDALVDWLKAFMETLQLSQAALVGHSFAGVIVRMFSAAYPTLVPALILVNGGMLPDTTRTARFLASLPMIGPRLFSDIAARSTSRTQLEDMIMVKGVLTERLVANVQNNRSGMMALMRGLTLSRLPAETVPRIAVMLLWGESDTITPKRTAEHLMSEIPGAKTAWLADTGHMPHIEAPDAFAAQVMFFLRNNDRGIVRKLPGVGMLG